MKSPIWITVGAVLPLAPEMQYTGEKPWDPVTLDCYPCAGKTSSATLYEDDTLTTAYQRGEFRNTPITVSADETAKTVHVEIGAAKGSFQGALKTRAWILRIHPPADWPKNPARGRPGQRQKNDRANPSPEPGRGRDAVRRPNRRAGRGCF